MTERETENARAFTEAALRLVEALKPFGEDGLVMQVDPEAGWRILREVAAPMLGAVVDGVVLADIRVELANGAATAVAAFFDEAVTVAWPVPCQKRPEGGYALSVPAGVDMTKVRLA